MTGRLRFSRCDAWLAEMLELIGEEAAVALAEGFGGTRLYVPPVIPSNHLIAAAIGDQAAKRLAGRYSPDVIKVPLLRDLRAMRYRRLGATNAQIAIRLCMTESGVEKLFNRLRETA